MSKKRWTDETGFPDDARAPSSSEGWSADKLLYHLPLARLESRARIGHIPRLEEISVTVPAPRPVTKQDLWEKCLEAVWNNSPRRQRRLGEPLREGDEIAYDFQGQANEKLIPNTLRLDRVACLSVKDLPPAYLKSLLHAKVGDTARVPVALSPLFPLEALRGLEAIYSIEVTSACEVEMPNMEDDAFLESEALVRLLDRGETLEDALDEMADEIEAERATGAWLEAYREIIDILVARSEVEVPSTSVELEIADWWNQTEGEWMVRKGMSELERQSALSAWFSYPYFRREAERRLKGACVVSAICEREGVEVTAETVGRAMIAPWTDAEEAQAIREMLKSEVGLTEGLVEAMRPLAVLNYLSEKVSLKFE